MTTDTDRIEFHRHQITNDYLLQNAIMQHHFYQNASTITMTKRDWKRGIMNQPFFGRTAIDQCIEKMREPPA